jgi:hypothetical protein
VPRQLRKRAGGTGAIAQVEDGEKVRFAVADLFDRGDRVGGVPPVIRVQRDDLVKAERQQGTGCGPPGAGARLGCLDEHPITELWHRGRGRDDLPGQLA